jgi:beta-glucosidase
MTELLRNQWGFTGYIVSDSWAVGGLIGRHHIADNYDDCVTLSTMAGMNVRTNFTPPVDHINTLIKLIKNGTIPQSKIDEMLTDIFRVKFKLGLFDNPYNQNPEESNKKFKTKASKKISKQASLESLVLLKNDGLLPLNINKYKNILVCGPNAKAVNHSISRYGPSHLDVVTVYKGIKDFVGNKANVDYAEGCDFFDETWPERELYEMPIEKKQQKMIDEAVEKAKKSDIVILAVGSDEETVGENRSRTSLKLPGNQLDLVKAIQRTGKPVVVVLINGRPLTINWTEKHVPAILEAWFPGEFGGDAIAETLFGEYNPGGKLTVTFPRTVGQIPLNFPFKRSSQKGQTHVTKHGTDYAIGKTRINTPLFPFGFGLSYTKFDYSNLNINFVSNNKVTVEFDLKNVGNYDGDEVVQLYISDILSKLVTYKSVLRGFERIHLKKGETKRVKFEINPEKDCTYLSKDLKQILEPGVFEVHIGASSTDIKLKGEFKVN